MGEVALGERRMPNSRCVRLRLLRTARRSAAGSCAASRKGYRKTENGVFDRRHVKGQNYNLTPRPCREHDFFCHRFFQEQKLRSRKLRP